MQPAVTNAQQWAAPAGAKTYRTYATDCGAEDDGSFVFCRSKAELDICHHCDTADGWMVLVLFRAESTDRASRTAKRLH